MTYIMPSKRRVPAAPPLAYRQAGYVRHMDEGYVRPLLKIVANTARFRGIAKGEKPHITTDAVMAMYMEQEGRCALTGIPFRFENDTKFFRNPYAPSIDRIDSSKGYEDGNYRLITTAANLALGDFGDEVFYEMCEAAIRHRAGNKERMKPQRPSENISEKSIRAGAGKAARLQPVARTLLVDRVRGT